MAVCRALIPTYQRLEPLSNVAAPINNNRQRSSSSTRIVITIDGKDDGVIAEKNDRVEETIDHHVDRSRAPRHLVNNHARPRPLTAEATLDVPLRISVRTPEKKFRRLSQGIDVKFHHPLAHDRLMRILKLMLSHGHPHLAHLALVLCVLFSRDRSIPDLDWSLFSHKEEKLAGGVGEQPASEPKTSRPRVTDKCPSDRVFASYFSNERNQELFEQCSKRSHTKRTTTTSVPEQQEGNTVAVMAHTLSLQLVGLVPVSKDLTRCMV